ncbi:MAG: DUF4097 family beta strand repeat protein [Candidatus Eisenbacteria bacterium]|nr:DUF4097 family beta strand repeat protein [Candidatus Eisenbacteria bacterium]
MLRLSCALLLSLAVAGPAAADTWEKTFATAGTPDLRLVADDASVHVATWDRAAIGVRVTTVGWQIGPRGVHIAAVPSGDRLDLEVREPHFRLDFGWTRRSVLVEVRLPAKADLDVRTGDGNITVAPLAGNIRLHTGDGDMDADRLSGTLELTTGDGHVRARGLDGALRAHAGDGPMEIEGRFEGLEVGTGDGSVVVTASEGSRLAAAWEMESGDGRLVLRIPRTLKADLDIHTGDGRIDVELPLEVAGTFGRSTVRGRLNGGGPPLRMRSGDGAIRIEPI